MAGTRRKKANAFQRRHGVSASVRPTMVDVGRVAGVSPTTVSFVVNGRTDTGISPETQRRVLDAIELLGYRPNLAAQGLRTRRTRTIGFISDDVAVSPPAGRTISGVHDVAKKHGTVLLTVNTTHDPRARRRAFDDLLDRQVDAIVFAVVGTKRVSLPTTVDEVPTLLVNCYVAHDELPCILPDEAAGGSNAAESVLAHGHTRIAFITGWPGAWATAKRLKGCRAAMKRAGVAFDERLVRAGNFKADSGYELATALLSEPDRPTAIMCGNDRMALGVYLALKERGVRVPEDMSVVGYDDQEDLAPEIQPPLTTVHLPYYVMGNWAAEHLLHGSIDDLPPRTYADCPLVPRASVGPLPRGR
jgi:LacI family transcriptional regulator